MSAPLPLDDRRPVPTVAIIGNDAVLMAAPATPVQLAHACLRRGFGVAVPASWGDELVAAEAMRRLASRPRGPAVMCVCPFVRSRLLAPGPDLAPFLVSLVSPPVATARYLRAVYGDHGVHITYIGGCPSGDDPSIDACLTPDAFLADLADNGIALAEQPLVFDSIVPPDRRRWGSLPGGSPTAEVLWSEADTRTLIEIERDDASTELAQHIIGQEHVLLDLAPALGCVCSGAISSLPARSARVAVTTVEPPRALGPVVDPSVVLSLDAPVNKGAPRAAARADGDRTDAAMMEQRLDELLGTQIETADAPVVVVQWDLEAIASTSDALREAPPPGEASPATPESPVFEPQRALADSTSVADDLGSSDAGVDSRGEPAETDAELAQPVDEPAEMTAAPLDAAPEQSTVRRRPPVPTHARHPSSSIPKAMASDGRALPRAYVAKRRTPPSGMPTVGTFPEKTAPEFTVPENTRPTADAPLAVDTRESSTATPDAVESQPVHDLSSDRRLGAEAPPDD